MILTEGRKEFLAWAGDNGKELLDKFLKNRQKYQAPENNMDYWVSKKKPEDLEKFMASYKSKNDAKKAEKSIAIEGANVIYNKNGWNCVQCLTYDAAKHYGQGTKWCITGRYEGCEAQGEYYFNSYLESNYDSYYVLTDLNKGALLVDDSDAEQKGGHEVQQDSGSKEKVRFATNKWCICTSKEDPMNKCTIWCADDSTVKFIDGAPYIPGLPPISRFTISDDGELIKVANDRGSCEIPDSVKKIGHRAFRDLSYEHIVIPSSVAEITGGAFAKSRIDRALIPDSVTSIGSSAFLMCNELERVTLGKGVTSLPARLFGYCDQLDDIVIKGVIENIDDNWLEGDNTDKISIMCPGKGNEKLIEWCKAHRVDLMDDHTAELLADRDSDADYDK